MTSQRTLLYEFVDGLVLLMHGELPPSNAEWDGYLEACRRALFPRAQTARVLVVTDGVAPTPTQRAALNLLVTEAGSHVATAVISHSVAVRSVVALLGMFNRGIRSFAPGDLSLALQYLEVDPARRADVLQRIVRVRIELSGAAAASEATPDMSKIAEKMDLLMLQRLPALQETLKR
jgi:hypothetical protein